MKILLAPLDPVHDAGLKLIKRKLEVLGYQCVLLPPDITVEEIGEAALKEKVDMIFVGRTVGYGVEQLFQRVREVLTRQGVFGKIRVAIGGMAVNDELAKALGFEGGYGPHTSIEEIHALIERDPELARHITHPVKHKPEFPFAHDYEVKIPGNKKISGQNRGWHPRLGRGQNLAGHPPRAHYRIAIAGCSRLGGKLHRAAVHARVSGAMRPERAGFFPEKHLSAERAANYVGRSGGVQPAH